MKITPEQIRQQYKPRFGHNNPEPVQVPFWDEQIRTGENAWQGRRSVLGEDYSDEEPAWTFDRFGSTATHLPDGRVVRIAGEHEDSYDPDFWIYNDVTVFNPDGTWQINLYPRNVFPPTDFHATVRIEQWLYVFGSLGHREDANRSFVYRLDTRTWMIERFDTANAPPVNLHECFALVQNDGREVRLIGGKWYSYDEREARVNDREWLLDLKSKTWRQGDLVEPIPRGPHGDNVGDGLKAVSSYEEAYRLIDCVRRTVSHNHPLFGLDLWPISNDYGQALFRVDDGSDRHVAVYLGWGESRAALKHIAYRFISDGEDGLALYLADTGSYDEYGSLRLNHAP